MFKPTQFISLVLILAIFTTSVSTASARSDNEEIAEAVAKAAAEGAAREYGWDLAAEIIDAGLKSAPPPSGESSAGSEAVAWVKLGISVKDFMDAENDQGRAWAAADVTVSALLIACPPAGAIAAVVVFAAKMINMKMSHDHAKEMMEIARRTQQHYESIFVMIRQNAKADALAFFNWQQGLQFELKKFNELQKAMEVSCKSLLSGKFVEKDLVDCQKNAVQVCPHVMNFLNLADHILGFRSDYINLDAYYKKEGKDINKIRTDIARLKEKIGDSQKQAREIYQYTGKLVAEAAVRQSMANGTLSTVIALRNQCFSNATHYARRLNLALVGKATGDQTNRRSIVAGIYAEASQSFNAGCSELVVSDQDPLLPQLVIYAQTLHSVEKILFQE